MSPYCPGDLLPQPVTPSRIVTHVTFSSLQTVSYSQEELDEAFRSAAENGKTEDLGILLAGGAIKDAKDEYGNTALHNAALYGRTASAEWPTSAMHGSGASCALLLAGFVFSIVLPTK